MNTTRAPENPKRGITINNVVAVFAGAKIRMPLPPLKLRVSHAHPCRVCGLPLPIDSRNYQILWAHQCWSNELREIPDEELSGADFLAIMEELARWPLKNGKYRRGLTVKPANACAFCDGPSVPEWRRGGKIVTAMLPGGTTFLVCHFCGRKSEDTQEKND